MNESVRELDEYIDNIHTSMENQRFNKNCMTVEHRSGNPKRDFLFVNKVQGKHIPAVPSDTVSMCNELSKVVNDRLKKYIRDSETDITEWNTLVVGFAETATAIAELVVSRLIGIKDIILTTREPKMDSEATKLLTFEEEHSHATTQNIYFDKNETREQFIAKLNEYDYILFIDDEISTGNTIVNFMKAFKSLNVKSSLRFGVASVCNWQSKNDQKIFESLNIDRFYLLGGELKDKNKKMDILEDYLIGASKLKYSKPNSINVHIVNTGVTGMVSNRLCHSVNHFTDAVEAVIDKIYAEIFTDKNLSGKNIRFIGTEEFMYLPLRVALNFEDGECNIKFHATTRSKIDTIFPVSISDIENDAISDEDFFRKITRADVINSSFKVPSFYEEGRDTYIYNIQDSIDTTIIITDAEPSEETMRYYANMFEELCICNDVHFILVK